MAVKTVEERLTVVEHKVAENARRADGLREAIVELGDRMDRRLESMEQRFDRRFETVEQNMSSQFRWIVGIQMTTLLAMIAAIAVLASAALGR